MFGMHKIQIDKPRMKPATSIAILPTKIPFITIIRLPVYFHEEVELKEEGGNITFSSKENRLATSSSTDTHTELPMDIQTFWPNDTSHSGAQSSAKMMESAAACWTGFREAIMKSKGWEE